MKSGEEWKSAAKLFEENLRYSNGEPVKVVIADTTIGRVGESAACADKFRREGVDITLTVTPCWCYGAETMDMDPQTIKAVWGFNGTERPGAVYLASVLATHAQKGLPAFGIYGHDVQEADDTTIPEDVKEKLFRFGRAAVAAASMRGNLTCRSVLLQWVSADLSSILISSSPILECVLSLLMRWKSSVV